MLANVNADYRANKEDNTSTSPEVTQSIGAQVLRIMVADDHDLVRQGLRSILEAQADWLICGEATTGHEAIDMARQLRPDVVVIDIHMPGMDGFRATREILAINSQTGVLILTIDETKEVVQAATEAGARGVVMKSDAARDLVAAVAALQRNETFYTPKVSQLIVQGLTQTLGATSGNRPLTERERDVVVLVAEGLGNKQVATALNICAKTVESHRRNIMHKLGLKSTAELVRYAVRDGLIQA